MAAFSIIQLFLAYFSWEGGGQTPEWLSELRRQNFTRFGEDISQSSFV